MEKDNPYGLVIAKGNGTFVSVETITRKKHEALMVVAMVIGLMLGFMIGVLI